MEKQSYTKLKMTCLQPDEYTPREVEITLPWDAGADDCVQAFITAMRGLTFFESTIEDAMRDYLEEVEESRKFDSDVKSIYTDNDSYCQKDLSVDD